MKKLAKWLVLTLVPLALLLGAGLSAVQRWLGTDDFKARVQSGASVTLGLPVKLASIQVDAWPVPAVALLGVEVQTQPILTAERVEVRVVWRPLLAGRLEVATVLVRRADLPQTGVDQLLASLKKKPAANAGSVAGPQNGTSDLIPRRIVLDAVTWRSAGGDATTVDAEALLSPQGLPDTLSLKVLEGRFRGAKAQLSRKSSLYDVRVVHAGGTIQGNIDWQDAVGAAKEKVLKGQFETRDVEISLLMAKSGTFAGAPADGTAPARQAGGSPLSGRLDATTTVTAHGPSAATLLDNLQTQSRFAVRNAVVHGIDLARAVKTIGLSRGGETRLDTLAGQLTSNGKAFAFNNLVASSGVLSASGNVAVAPNRSLTGRVQVNIGSAGLGGAVGVPLVVGGTLDAPAVGVTQARMLGAAIGTLFMPGVGTGVGASLGDEVGSKLKGLFGK